MTALRLIRVLDVLHEYAYALESARALSSRPFRPLASRPGETSGPEVPPERTPRSQSPDEFLACIACTCYGHGEVRGGEQR